MGRTVAQLSDKPLSAWELPTATWQRSQTCNVRRIMMMRGILLTTISVLVLLGLAPPNAAGAQDQLAAAKELYRAAAFEDALTSFESLAANVSSATPQSREVARYRAFCLIALGRYRVAEQAIESIILAEPTYIPSESEVSPRISSAFRDIRRRILPGIARDIYAVARSAFDRKEYPAAAAQFERVLALVEDADMGPATSEYSAVDLKLMAAAFLDLSRAQATPSQR
jgi:tetratricopeptide (TPR) repeat protein